MEIEMEIGYEKGLQVQLKKERAAVKLQNKVGKLLYDKGIELVLFRRHLIDKNISDILRLHQYATDFVKKPINVFETSKLAKNLIKMDLAPSKIDIGKLTYEFLHKENIIHDQIEFLNERIGFLKNSDDKKQNSKDVVLFGFGRIGR